MTTATMLTAQQIDSLPYSVRLRGKRYATEIDHDGHEGDVAECEVCEAALAGIQAALPSGWTACWTGHGNGTEVNVEIRTREVSP